MDLRTSKQRIQRRIFCKQNDNNKINEDQQSKKRSTVNPQPLHPSTSAPLPSQPFPNPNGGINIVQANNEGHEEEEENGKEKEGDKDHDWLYDPLAKLVGESSDSKEECDEPKEAEVVESDDTVEVSNPDKEEEFFIAMVYRGNEEKPEDIPEKCVDPGPFFVTCKIGNVYV
ncbi:hypothetical protein PIB30_046771 [Stylosanthes scabra]|uniref:Uncharacterized protein n=1 Tax=Stylosanthes scabra TaxID=79078 RepID=A0ABU6XFD9_9FABA|nr:hypothetical protein [Stylosanthes scabra]